MLLDKPLSLAHLSFWFLSIVGWQRSAAGRVWLAATGRRAFRVGVGLAAPLVAAFGSGCAGLFAGAPVAGASGDSIAVG
jgi:hypothetical protein